MTQAYENHDTRAAWDKIAPGYDRTNTPTQVWIANEGFRRAGLRPGMRFLDVAAGSGALSIQAARLGAQVLAAAEVERTSRQGLHHALENFLQREGWRTGGSQGLPALLKGCLSFLSASPAPVALVNLEDLWLEREPQNVPGTHDERPNWQRKARYTSEAFQEMPAVLDPLRAINDLRRRGKGSRGASFERQRHAGRTKMASRDGGRKKVGSAGPARKLAQPKARPVTFQWMATEASAVSVVGDFNNWDPQAHPFRKGKDGLWKVVLRLKSGRYEYMFIVDGEWREDPRNPNRVPNPHGGFNSVCEVA